MKLETFPAVAAGASAAFSLRGVTRRLGGKTVLDRLDLDVPAGQFLAIVGKSGCGKSTLLRLLTGLDAPDEGRIDRGSARGPSDIRIMFQEARLLPWARVVENVAVGLTGLARGAAAHQRAVALLDEVGLSGRGGDWPSALSGGQRQRVALARALIGKPKILALDEPLGALDALTRIEMQRLLHRIWHRQGFTAVLVTHDVSEAVMLADRIVMLDQGRIAMDIDVTLPRPRHHGAPEAARLEEAILSRFFEEDR
ncbi:ATP-binding cassette domain-containing protein [Cereibacter azotoformans]|uniref:Sulfonate transport system ATP-binding protein n=1 Tax=Cereibacter azotoformans TaxID=43057 RepID=A0A2T5JT41_9RHOB|nr:ATP-binding cassette domain-containing protein [Cereibacter azotoformans]AXQ95725.1 ATP-binding cassette domain-containing protein [Cereibacter sphaeroides]PTR12979.1 sulfonate transport system ATP-binding protein [Cereibacter azotoformans]UIJ32775.1 ATP-binding cassette domain-containing protein [Cereibacter azotoformans]